ncbi:flotillin family protein [Lactococcus protaetiae]|uniref:Flotillin family protein n=1 Tax=Lactococcus protaetiae TaxID=2592653 RepID=A0A514ZAZ1_9LACT|nr:SPFH domain-containing protein [Lactococcus protaetiae]MCL2112832.1 SPFH domain-containing protein [Streptococcaceae bacterium]QDK71753.1 flotillin family protein [Lactococcus protaetiae]
MNPLFILGGAAVVVVLIIIAIIVVNYKKSGPQAALIVYGAMLGSKGVNKDSQGNKLKVVRGSGTFVLPGLQSARYLSLQSSALDIQADKVYSKNKIPVTVDATAMIKVGSSLQEIATAAEQFLGKKDVERDGMADRVLKGHLRAIIGTMTVSELIEDRDKFSKEVQAQAATDLAKMGLQVVSFVVNDIRDNQNYIQALGAEEVARVQQNAAVAVAEADKQTRIKKAQADQEAQQAEAESATRIADAQKGKAIQLASFDQEEHIAQADAKTQADIAQAKADQAYAIQEAKSKQETTDAEMQVEIIKRKRATELEQQEVLRAAQEKQATIVAEANAQKEAQIAKAQAEAEEQKIKALAEAEAILAKGKAQAEAIRLNGEAEAEAIEKKAEAMKHMTDAAILNMAMEVLPKVVGSVSENLRAVDSIKIYGGEGSDKIMGMSASGLQKGLDVMKEMGVDIPQLMTDFASHKNTASIEEKNNGDFTE